MLDGDVKTFPALFPAAHKAGEGKFLRVWYLARYLDGGHGFRVRYDGLLTAVVEHLNVSARYAARLIEEGDNLWWRIDGKNGWIYISGVKRICEHLGVEYSDDTPVVISIQKLRKLNEFYATCYAAYMRRYTKGNRSFPVSRTHLMNIMGVCLSTLRLWEKAAGVIVHENIAFARPDDIGETPNRQIEYHCACGEAFNSLEKYLEHRKTCREKDYFIVWQLPNSYEPPEMKSSGTASPICRTRMADYRRKRNIPAATKCHMSGPAASGTDQPCASSQTRSAAFRYRQPRKSDPLPDSILRRNVSTDHVYRAFRV